MTTMIFPATLANIDTGEYRVAKPPIAVFDKVDRGLIQVPFEHLDRPGAFTLKHAPHGEVWAQIAAS